MAIILRIDVDNPYGHSSLFEKALNHMRMNYPFPRVSQLGYLHNLIELTEELDNNSAQATILFKRDTLPGKKLANKLKAKGHVLGMHAVDTSSYDAFAGEKEAIEKECGPVRCFSKHGHSGVKLSKAHDPEYNVEKLLDFGRRAGMSCFFGNGTDPSEMPKRVGGLAYFPSAFWMKPGERQNTNRWLLKESKKRDIVVLIHPIEWRESATLKAEIENIVRKGDFITARL